MNRTLPAEMNAVAEGIDKFFKNIAASELFQTITPIRKIISDKPIEWAVSHKS